ncbi:MAG: MoxR family ATPase [Actinobacteria bacterium]|nr:MoxR family ATPase [Actinomycetota bacterium]
MTQGRFANALGAITGSIIGLDREAEILAVALDTGRHVVLEGPPGTGKSSLLRMMCRGADLSFVFVEGNAELTPSRLLGSYDPAMVLEGGYRADAFVEGPLVWALREGSVLYIEEFNRVPEETLNVLITALEEGEAHIPRYGTVHGAEGFRLVAAMNPFDAIGTARISHVVSDRTCRIAIGYQEAEREQAIIGLHHDAPPEVVEFAVELTRKTRDHPEIRIGASVRGAIDVTVLAVELAARRGVDSMTRDTLRDAARAALTGRIRIDESGTRSPDEIIDELFAALFDARANDPPDGQGKVNRLLRDQEADQGKH